MCSVKPFKSKNRDKIFLDAKNPNLKKGCDRDFRATAQPMDYYVCLLDEKYHNLFSDLNLEHPYRFYHDFSI